MTRLGLFTLVVTAACGSTTSSPPPSSDLDLSGLGHDLGSAHVAAAPADAAAPTPTAADAAAPVDTTTTTTVAGESFADDAMLIYRIAACGGDPAQRIPEGDGPPLGDPIRRDKLRRIVDRHCKNLLERIAKFRAAYFEKHAAWFERVVPKDLPTTVVYPFGGGDLLSALVAFPDATEITTISLELAGDPRRLRSLPPRRLGNSLAALRVEIGGLLSVGSNTSVNLSAQQRSDIPGQVASFMMGLVAGGYEPVDMRYFRLEPDGRIHYLDKAEIDDADAKNTHALKGDWEDPSFSKAFSHVEIRYRKIGETTIRVHRHFGWNLSDAYLRDHPALLAHLEAKGKVTMLTKGASYLLHRPSFSIIRNYMLDHLAWMLSDSTGIPPLYARRAGMQQITYGHYSGAFLEGSRDTRADQSFVDLWRRSPRRRLGFRFGYVDASGTGHLVVTRPK